MQLINWDELVNLCQDNSLKQEFTGSKRIALTIGVFDGLHRGHQALITKITGKAPGLLPAVITFRNNPKKTNNKMVDIISFEEKITLLDSLGISLAVIIDFSEHFSKMKGKDFLQALNRYLCPAYISLGGNFHCGYHKDTDAQAFKALAERLGVETEIVPPVLEGGMPISSSRIREALRALNYKEASLLLGRRIKPTAEHF